MAHESSVAKTGRFYRPTRTGQRCLAVSEVSGCHSSGRSTKRLDFLSLFYQEKSEGNYYDPLGGRWMATDPANPKTEEPFTYNSYMYANNNPLKYVDPDGRDAILATFRFFPSHSRLYFQDVNRVWHQSDLRVEKMDVQHTFGLFGKGKYDHQELQNFEPKLVVEMLKGDARYFETTREQDKITSEQIFKDIDGINSGKDKYAALWWNCRYSGYGALEKANASTQLVNSIQPWPRGEEMLNDIKDFTGNMFNRSTNFLGNAISSFFGLFN